MLAPNSGFALLTLGTILGATLFPGAAFSQSQDVSADANCCGYYVDGTVFADLNGDGIQNGADYGLVGWTVEVVDPVTSLVIMSTVTIAGGYYIFENPVNCNVPFWLREIPQTGWTQTSPLGPNHHVAMHASCAGEVFGPYDFGNCQDFLKVYTVDSEFYEGDLNGVVTNSDQLELDPIPSTFQYAWIANANEGTISKVDTDTGDEVARYYTGPPDGNGHSYLNPSRTVVDKDGNCWVANRTNGDYPSITQILTGGGEDFNGNTIIETSFDASSNGEIEPSEMLPWGQDERVVRHYQLGTNNISNGARAFALDKNGFLWVGLTSDSRLVKVKPDHPISVYGSNQTPSVVPEEASVPLGGYFPYGMALSPSGLLYISTLSSYAFELDPGIASGGTAAGPALTQSISHDGLNYGIAVDQDCIVWLAGFEPANLGCVRWDPTVGVGNPAVGWAVSTPGTVGNGRGITVDFNGDIWMATDYPNGVARYDGSGNWIANYPVNALIPVGVGISSDGNLIVVPNAGSDWDKIDTTTGSLIPLAGPQMSGLGPYTYSDFTGSLQNLVSQQQGFWQVITDSGSSGSSWNFIDWNGSTPPNTSIEVDARSASTITPLLNDLIPWIPVTTPGVQSPTWPGQFLETRVRLRREVGCGDQFVTPILYDLTVGAPCDTCSFVSCGPDIIVDCQTAAGSFVDFPVPELSESCSGNYEIVCTPSSGSLFPLGQSVVECIATNAQGEIILCTFVVEVVGDCFNVPLGACCLGDNCTQETEANCGVLGGIYFGDGSSCANGCEFLCLKPPQRLTAWWSFDTESGGITPNLADPALGGTLVGPPTHVTGEYVNQSYDFDGATEYISVPHGTSLNLGGGDFSMDAWVKLTNSQGNYPILDKEQGSPLPLQGYQFLIDDGYPALQLTVNGTGSNFVLTASNGGGAAFVADGEWHLVAVTVDRNDPNGLQFYVDGVAVGTPFDPTARQGNLNNGSPLLIAKSYATPFPETFFAGGLDEIEIFRRELTRTEMSLLYRAGEAGKCREACYASELTSCCDGHPAAASITICNYENTPHLYSWGVTPQSSGVDCFGNGAQSFNPVTGSVVVPGYGCVVVPIEIECPTGVPIGSLSCFQVSIFNHDTGSLFGCTGSVRRPSWWCSKWELPGSSPLRGVLEIEPDAEPTRINLVIAHVIYEPAPDIFEYRLVPLDADGQPSQTLAIGSLEPGLPLEGSADVDATGRVMIPVSVSYREGESIGFDRVVLYTDDNMDGEMEPIGEQAFRVFRDEVTGVQSGTPGEDPLATRSLLSLPNPYSGTGQIQFRVVGGDESSDGTVPVTLRLYDARGRVVRIFHRKAPLVPGIHTLPWDGTDDRHKRLPSGMYFLRYETPEVQEDVKLLLMR